MFRSRFSLVRIAASWLIGGVAPAAIVAQSVPTRPGANVAGQWTGRIRHGEETGFFGLDVTPAGSGNGLFARLWMPDLNAFGSVIGPVQVDGDRVTIPALGISLTASGDSLTGAAPPELRFSLARDGPLPAEPPVDSTLPRGPDPVWSYQAGAAFWTTPVIDRGIAYLGDASGTVHAVDARTGKKVWTRAAGAPLYGSVAVDGGGVYLVTDAGLLLKLDRGTGAERWRVDVGGAGVRSIPDARGAEWDFQTAQPAVARGVVYVGSATGAFPAVDAETGRVRWTFTAKGRIRAAACVDGNRVYLGSMDNLVYALDAGTGAELWRFDTGSPVTTAPMVADGKVIIGTRDRALLCALDAADGTPRWSVYYWFSWVESTPVLHDGLLYVGASDSRRIRAIEPATGRVRWATQVWGWTWGTPLVLGDKVYYGTAGAPSYFISQRASLGALDRETGRILWRRPISLLPQSYMSGVAGSLVASGDRFLAAGLDGVLRAFPAR
jgi:outer membrane protein assembly factor BamB